MKARLTILLLCIAMLCHAQDGWKYNGNFNFGCNLNLVYGKGQSFPGIRFYAGFIANGVYKDHFILNYGPSISIYTKTIGASLNPLVNDIQIDFINSISLGGGWEPISYRKFFRTLGNGSYYNVLLDQAYAGMLTSNFILNNHHRNQVNAAVTASVQNVTVYYCNDGAWPKFLAFADNFDRYWTGSAGIFVHNKDNYNVAEFTFDQFTGYQPFIYELATKIGIDVPNYNLADSIGVGGVPNFNTSQYNLKITPMRGYSVDIGAIGSLKSKHGRFWGIQEIIHTLGGFAFHPNYDITRFYIGGTYNYFSNVAF